MDLDILLKPYYSSATYLVPCKRRSSLNSGAWLRWFDDDDVTGLA